jgi:superoxide dismutase
VKNFGAGWTWLVKEADGKLAIVSTSNAGTPLTTSAVVLIVPSRLTPLRLQLNNKNKTQI